MVAVLPLAEVRPTAPMNSSLFSMRSMLVTNKAPQDAYDDSIGLAASMSSSAGSSSSSSSSDTQRDSESDTQRDSESGMREGKLRRTTSPRLVMMLDEGCDNSFVKRDDEEPIHIWNTKEVEAQNAHNERMRKLDRKLAKYNDEIAQLEVLLRHEEVKHQKEMSRIEQREKDAREEMVALEEQVQKAATSEVQYEQLRTRLTTNCQTIRDLKSENKKLSKDYKCKEKHYDSLKYHNRKLEESCESLFDSYSELVDLDELHVENDGLQENHEAAMDEHKQLKIRVRAMQHQYMEEAVQRLELQRTLAQMLYWIQDHGGLKGVTPRLANKCTQIGIDCEARAKQLIQKIEEYEELRDGFAAM